MSYFNNDDCQLHYEEYGHGAPVLLVHGLGSSTRDWEYQIPELARYYRVIALDVRGHGRSDKPRERYSIQGLPRMWRHLSSTCNCRRCIWWVFPWAA